MGRFYSWNDILVMPGEVRAFAWSAPMRELARKVGMSDVGLKKLLASYGVVAPPQGYWNKVHAGKTVPKPPKPPPRRAGEIGRIRIDSRFASVLTPVPPMPSHGPFASGEVPENLEALRAQELKAIGRVAVPRTLERPHMGLLQLLKREERRHEKQAERQWNWDSPRFDDPVGKRRLRILNGILLALAKRGHNGDVQERDGELEVRAIVGDTYLGVAINVFGKHRKVRLNGYDRPAPDLPASTPLVVRIDSGFDGKTGEAWHDDQDGKLESKIVPIAAAIIVAGEAKFRRSLREAEEREEQMRVERERLREVKLAELNNRRLADLRKSGELLRQAQDIRALVELVRDAMLAGPLEIDTDALAGWERWALAEADRIDPVRSGQIMTHLREPTVDPMDP